jgi:hypothetical protein
MSLRSVVRIKRSGHKNAEGSGLSVAGRYFTRMSRRITSLTPNLPLKGPRGEDWLTSREPRNVPSGVSHWTSTMQFIAIEMLQGKGHPYQHDLKSLSK